MVTRRKPGEWLDGESCAKCGTRDHEYARGGHCWKCLYEMNLEGKSKGRKKQQRIKVDVFGEHVVLCLRCQLHYPIEKFVVNPQTHRIGKHCNDCRGKAAADRTASLKARKVSKRQQDREADILYNNWLEETRKGGQRLIDISRHFDLIESWVEQLIREADGVERAADASGIPVRRIQSLRYREQARTTAETLEKLAESVDGDLEPVIPTGLDGWSRTARACVECGTWWHDHHSHGRCLRCYQRYRRRGFTDDPGYWAKAFGLYACRNPECGRNDVKHAGRGLCRNCYSKHYRLMMDGRPSLFDDETPERDLSEV